MNSATPLVFPPFRLDLGNEQLLHQVGQTTAVLHLRPKTFTVLRHLVEHAPQLITKDQLLDTIWPDTYVTDSVLKSCIRELRRALNDDAKQPLFIETVHRRGYRFIAEVQGSKSKTQSAKANRPVADSQPLTPYFVGREGELAQLHQWLENALQGKPQIVFVSGEAGIGKTALAETFVEQAQADRNIWIGHGQCIEQYGAGEPYMPLLEALSRLGQEDGATAFVSSLQKYAPTWLAQMPALFTPEEFEDLQPKIQGMTRERMLREITEALEVITKTSPLVLVLEDLHWSDFSTLEFLSALGRRSGRARLFILATYRSTEVINGHPLRGVVSELQLHGQSKGLRLGLLSATAIETYVSQRFPANQFAPQLGVLLARRTEGNPLFLVNVVDDFVRDGLITKEKTSWTLQLQPDSSSTGMPENIRQAIERQIDRLSEYEQHVLETASAVGLAFSSGAVAAGLEAAAEEVETCCNRLVRQGHFLQDANSPEWPGEVVTARYRFIHALYQEVLYARLAVSKRGPLHQRIGVWGEQTHGQQAGTVAAELALHFERSRDLPRAVRYHQRVGENAIQRRAHHEAALHFSNALSLLESLPDSAEQTQQALALYIALAVSLGVTHGYGAPQVEAAYSRAWELCQKSGETTRHFPVLAGLTIVYQMRGKLRRAHEVGVTLTTIAQRTSYPLQVLWAHLLQGTTLYNMGEPAAAREQLEQSLAIYDPHKHGPQVSGGRDDPGIICLSTLASALWLLGYPDQALHKIQQALSLATELDDVLSRALALGQAAVLHQRRREAQSALAHAGALLTLAQENGFPLRAATAQIYHGWALAESVENDGSAEGLTQIQAGLEAITKTGGELAHPYYLALLGETYGKARQFSEGLEMVEKALTIVDKNADCFYEAELWRLKGELRLKQVTIQNSKSTPTSPQRRVPNPCAAAETDFQQALAIARRQQARSLELRAAVSLAHLWRQQGKREQARSLLEEVYTWFTEGFETRDLQEAKALLDLLS